MITRHWGLALALFGAASAAQATTVVPLALPELAREADAIVRVKVLEGSARRGAFHDAPAIVTDLEFALLEVLKGEPPRSLTVFGGTVGDQTMTLIGQPELRPGDEAFLFLITQQAVTCPYVGVWQGVYLVRDGQVWRERAPVVDVVDGEVLFAEDHERGMSPAGFAAEVRRALTGALRPELRAERLPSELPQRALRLRPAAPAPHAHGAAQ